MGFRHRRGWLGERLRRGGASSDNAFKITPGGVISQIIDATGDGAGNTLDDPFGIAVAVAVHGVADASTNAINSLAEASKQAVNNEQASAKAAAEQVKAAAKIAKAAIKDAANNGASAVKNQAKSAQSSL